MRDAEIIVNGEKCPIASRPGNSEIYCAFATFGVIEEIGSAATGQSTPPQLIYALLRQLKRGRLDFPGVPRSPFQFGDAVTNVKTRYRDRNFAGPAGEIEDPVIATNGK